MTGLTRADLIIEMYNSKQTFLKLLHTQIKCNPFLNFYCSTKYLATILLFFES